MSASPAQEPDVVDEYEQAIPHVRDTVRAASRAAVNTLRMQGEATNSELEALGRSLSIVNAQYKEKREDIMGVRTFKQETREQYAALQPYLEKLSKLEETLDELQTLAKTLDTRSRELELALYEA